MKPAYYIVQAVRNGVQLPTFILDANIQGIINREHAERVARDIVDGGNGVASSIFIDEVQDLKELGWNMNNIKGWFLVRADDIATDYELEQRGQ